MMISPDSWREIWKPRYARVYQAAKDEGMLTFLHSCGYIVDILDDLIEIGLDVIQMDQQENMGLENLDARVGGQLAFWCPVDIQQTMVHGFIDDIEQYVKRMIETVGSHRGGLISMAYSTPEAVHHTKEKLMAMSAAFRRHGVYR